VTSLSSRVAQFIREYIKERELDTVSKKSVVLAVTNRFLKVDDKLINEAIETVLTEDFCSSDEEVEDGKSKSRGFNKKKMVLSPVLAEFLGVDEETRPQIVKRMWEYFREHELQNPQNKREIICDEKLQKVFRRHVITMFNMNKFLSGHIRSQDQLDQGVEFDYDIQDTPSKNTKPKKRKKAASDDQPVKKRETALTKPILISAELSEFLGGQKMAARGEVVQALWKHIKDNNLQNPEKKTEIICDDQLKRLLNHDTCSSFSMNKYIQAHFKKDI